MFSLKRHRKIRNSLIFIAFTQSVPVALATPEPTPPCINLNIPSQNAAAAVQRLARATGATLVYSYELLKGR